MIANLPSTASRRASVALVALLAGSMAPSGSWAKGDILDLPQAMDEYAATHGGPAPLFAIRPPNVFTHNVGLLQMQITNIGMIGNFFIDAFSAGWRGGEYLFAAGLWVGAKRSDNQPHVTTAVYDLEFLPPTDPEWTVYESFEGAFGGNRLGFSAGPQETFRMAGEPIGDITTSGANDDWNGGDDVQIDEDFLNGLDDDGDGAVDEDFEAVAQQMFSCQYIDTSPFTQESEPDHTPLNLLVQQRSFAWATTGANEFIGFDFKIWNTGTETLSDVFLAFFVDADAGPKDHDSYWVDDKGGYVEVDTTVVDETVPPDAPCRDRRVVMNMAYVRDTPDSEINEEQGGVRGGDVPGFFGGMFLGHTTDPNGIEAPSQVRIRRARFFAGGSAPYPDGDPRNDNEAYDLISGEGVPLSNETVKVEDYRYVISAGPFRSLPADTFLTFQTAFVIGEGRGGLIDNAVQAQLIYDGAWRNADENDQTGAGGKELCVRPRTLGETFAVWDDPCDTTGTETRFNWPGFCDPTVYVNNDCDGCTPLASEDEPGPEQLVHWVGTVAPPPPLTNADGSGVGISPGGNRSVRLQWDNLSELKADPIQRKLLFEGYRIWRVEGWRRPVGSTGPSTEEWQLVAQIVRHPDSPPDTCWVQDPKVAGARIPFLFNTRNFLGNWVPDDPGGILPDDPCVACPDFCWPNRNFLVDETLVPIETGIATGDTTPGFERADLYPVGRYNYVDAAGIKNGMIYFYDVTAFSAWDDIQVSGTDTLVRHFELGGRPVARETQRIVPAWSAQDTKNEIYVVPNPYVQGDRTILPWGWDLIPSDSDPTGTRLAFANLPIGRNVIKVYTLGGDLVQTIDHNSETASGTAYWNLVSRNGQDIVAGVYLFTVKTETDGTKVGRFVVVR
jgi:hypothetical protein